MFYTTYLTSMPWEQARIFWPESLPATFKYVLQEVYFFRAHVKDGLTHSGQICSCGKISLGFIRQVRLLLLGCLKPLSFDSSDCCLLLLWLVAACQQSSLIIKRSLLIIDYCCCLFPCY